MKKENSFLRKWELRFSVPFKMDLFRLAVRGFRTASLFFYNIVDGGRFFLRFFALGRIAFGRGRRSGSLFFVFPTEFCKVDGDNAQKTKKEE